MASLASLVQLDLPNELVAQEVHAFALSSPQIGVEAAAAQQLIVRATLDNAPMIHDQDLVRIDDGGKAMGDHQRGDAAGDGAGYSGSACSVPLSKADVASSRMRMRGRLRIARASGDPLFLAAG